MGEKLEKIKSDNIENFRIGACAELTFCLDNILSDFGKIDEFLKNNKELLRNQKNYEFQQHFGFISDIITSSIDILLNDIDPENIHCNYLKRYY